MAKLQPLAKCIFYALNKEIMQIAQNYAVFFYWLKCTVLMCFLYIINQKNNYKIVFIIFIKFLYKTFREMRKKD